MSYPLFQCPTHCSNVLPTVSMSYPLFQCPNHCSQATGAHLSTVVNATATVILALTLAFVFGWKLALVCTAFVPLLVGTGFAQTALLVNFAKGSKASMEDGGRVIHRPFCLNSSCPCCSIPPSCLILPMLSRSAHMLSHSAHDELAYIACLVESGLHWLNPVCSG